MEIEITTVASIGAFIINLIVLGIGFGKLFSSNQNLKENLLKLDNRIDKLEDRFLSINEKVSEQSIKLVSMQKDVEQIQKTQTRLEQTLEKVKEEFNSFSTKQGMIGMSMGLQFTPLPQQPNRQNLDTSNS